MIPGNSQCVPKPVVWTPEMRARAARVRAKNDAMVRRFLATGKVRS